MKRITGIAIALTAFIGCSYVGTAGAAGLSFAEKQQISCKAIASSVSEVYAKSGGTFRDSMRVYDSSFVLCSRSYLQASADYPVAKAKKAADKEIGNIGVVIVEMAFDSYKEDTK